MLCGRRAGQTMRDGGVLLRGRELEITRRHGRRTWLLLYCIRPRRSITAERVPTGQLGDNWIEACDCTLHLHTLQTSMHLPGWGSACCVIACQLVSECSHALLPNALPCPVLQHLVRRAQLGGSSSRPAHLHANPGTATVALIHRVWSCGGEWKMEVLYSLLPCCA